MSLYQFLIAVRSEGAHLTTVDGEPTSHLMGTFYRTIRFIENGNYKLLSLIQLRSVKQN